MWVQYISGGIVAIVLLSVLLVTRRSTPSDPNMVGQRFVFASKMRQKDNRENSGRETDVSHTPLEDLDQRIRKLATVIEAPEGLLPKHRGVDFGNAMIEYDGRYRYLFMERGERYNERVTDDIDEVLYWTFNTITRAMAGEHALVRQVPQAGDFRRPLFGHQLQLLNKLSPSWAQRHRAELDKILELNPFTEPD